MARILLVDDDPITLKMLSKAVELGQNIPLTCPRALKVVSTAEAEQPDLILMDMHMPDKDGLELIGDLKANTKTAAIPILILTASAEVDLDEQVRAAGGHGTLIKPINLKFLNEVILEHTAHR